MTNERVSDFASELVQMALATQRVPVLEREVETLTARCEAYLNQVQSLELRAIDRNSEITTLHATIRELEVARDNAETMFLEADDKAIAWRRLVSSFQADAAALLEAQEPPKKVEDTAIVEAVPMVDPTLVPVPQTGTGTDVSTPGTEGVSVQPDPTQAWTQVSAGLSGQPRVVNETASPSGTTLEHSPGATSKIGTLHHNPDGTFTVGEREADPMQSGQSGPQPASPSAIEQLQPWKNA